VSKGQRIRARRRQAPPPVGKRQPPDRRLWIGGALLLAAAVAGVAIAATRSGGTKAAKPVDEAALPALQTGLAPWGTAKEQFMLGQFFAIWGVRFTPHALGGYRSRADRPIRFYLDGKRYTPDPTRLALASHQQIAVVIGKPPSRIPASYAFPAGE